MDAYDRRQALEEADMYNTMPPPTGARLKDLEGIIDEADELYVISFDLWKKQAIGKFKHETNVERLERIVRTARALFRGWAP